ncbi:ATP-dependent nuclease [Coraliomargarita sp. W4R72]
MARIVNLHIQNYRGIQNLELNVSRPLTCFIGRGDSGKTTILDAIHAVLNPAWNLTFHDTDFFNCSPSDTIEISATVIDIPKKLLAEGKYGLLIRGYSHQTGIITDEIEGESVSALTVRLTVDKSLEPNWTVQSGNEHVEKIISANDRSQFNCFKVADYVDSHFSWSKGTPLSSLLRSLESSEAESDTSLILEALRKAKEAIDQGGFENLDAATKAIIKEASSLGLDIAGASTTIDARDLTIRDGKICLHDGHVPFRLKGKGSKRLASMAIQSALAQEGGIMLIDEIEQGLEPDRISNLVRTLKDENNMGQIFMTTHSRDAICELDVSDQCLLVKDKVDNKLEAKGLDIANDNLKKAVRACPEAFFAARVIVCEGKTEIGICRALDAFRMSNKKQLMAFRDCAYVDGGGSSQIDRASEIANAGFKVAVLCDSDVKGINAKKPELEALGIKIFDCSEDLSIEVQSFQDLPWDAVNKMVDYMSDDAYNDLDSFGSALKSKYEGSLPEDWKSVDRAETRTALALLAQKKELLKRIDHGQKLGEVIFGCFDEIDGVARLKTMLKELSDWIDE